MAWTKPPPWHLLSPDQPLNRTAVRGEVAEREARGNRGFGLLVFARSCLCSYSGARSRVAGHFSFLSEYPATPLPGEPFFLPALLQLQQAKPPPLHPGTPLIQPWFPLSLAGDAASVFTQHSRQTEHDGWALTVLLSHWLLNKNHQMGGAVLNVISPPTSPSAQGRCHQKGCLRTVARGCQALDVYMRDLLRGWPTWGLLHFETHGKGGSLRSLGAEGIPWCANHSQKETCSW